MAFPEQSDMRVKKVLTVKSRGGYSEGSRQVPTTRDIVVEGTFPDSIKK